MTAIGELVRSEREKRGWTKRQLATYADVSHMTVNKIEDGISERPTPIVLQKLATALRLEKSVLLVAAGYLTETTVVKKPKTIQIIGEIKAGPPMIAIQEQDGVIEISQDLADRGVTFALRVKGDSMIEEGIPDGSVALIRQTPTVDSGTLAAVLIEDDGACVKFFYRENGIVTLKSANPIYPDIKLPAQTVQIIGEVIETRKRHR